MCFKNEENCTIHFQSNQTYNIQCYRPKSVEANIVIGIVNVLHSSLENLFKNLLYTTLVNYNGLFVFVSVSKA